MARCQAKLPGVEDEETFDEIPHRDYVGGPPTIEEVSPFHAQAHPGTTMPGMPPPRLDPPRIVSRKDTTPGMPAPVPASIQAPVLTPPQIIHSPSDGDGPTIPDGVPLVQPPGLGSVTEEMGLDEMPTDPYAGRRVKGVVPAPDAPKVMISKSMEYDVSGLDLHANPPLAPAKKPRRPMAPTEVNLPTLEKRGRKERSDAWLVVGLIFLVFLIFALIGAVVVGVIQRLA